MCCNSFYCCSVFYACVSLTHWGRVTHICVSKLTIIGSDNGLLPGRRQAIIRTNAGILFIEPLGTNFSEILIEIRTFSFKKMCLKVSSAKRRPFCLGLNVLSVLFIFNKGNPSQRTTEMVSAVCHTLYQIWHRPTTSWPRRRGRFRKTWSYVSVCGLDGIDPQDRNNLRAGVQGSLVLPNPLDSTLI